jgi:hypothetical protein
MPQVTARKIGGYPVLVANPEAETARVNLFLGGKLDEAAMARAVEPALYRERTDRPVG